MSALEMRAEVTEIKPKRQGRYIETWTLPMIDQLTQLWIGGYTTSEIGRQMGVSKNAVIGKARRIDLPMRYQPKHYLRLAPEPRGLRFVDLSKDGCRWPFNDPQESNFHFCGDPIAEGKPYCETHCAVAYVKPKKTVLQIAGI